MSVEDCLEEVRMLAVVQRVLHVSRANQEEALQVVRMRVLRCLAC